jgi:hypothetical protein
MPMPVAVVAPCAWLICMVSLQRGRIWLSYRLRASLPRPKLCVHVYRGSAGRDLRTRTTHQGITMWHHPAMLCTCRAIRVRAMQGWSCLKHAACTPLEVHPFCASGATQGQPSWCTHTSVISYQHTPLARMPWVPTGLSQLQNSDGPPLTPIGSPTDSQSVPH